MTYLALLLAVAITSGALAMGASLWSQTQRRERETQLLWAGDQIRKSIVAYAQFGSEGGNMYPAVLQDLLLDPRSPAPRRFLRQIYDDPMTRSTDWGIIRNPQGRIVGVYSRSDRVPLKTGRFPTLYANFESAATYADWKFTTVPEPRVGDRPRAQPDAASSPAIDRGARATQASAPGTGAAASSRTPTVIDSTAPPAGPPLPESSAEPNRDEPQTPPDEELEGSAPVER